MLEGPLHESGLRDAADAKSSAMDEAYEALQAFVGLNGSVSDDWANLTGSVNSKAQTGLARTVESDRKRKKEDERTRFQCA